MEAVDGLDVRRDIISSVGNRHLVGGHGVWCMD